MRRYRADPPDLLQERDAAAAAVKRVFEARNADGDGETRIDLTHNGGLLVYYMVAAASAFCRNKGGQELGETYA